MIFLLIILVLETLIIVIPLLIAVAYFTIAERKIMGAIQRRKGPNVIGYIGLFQPFADGLKLFVKETILPNSSNLSLFLLAPSFAFILSLIGWAVIPYSEKLVFCNLNLGILYLFTISALNVYSILFAGWSSNSKYPYLGALRSVAQMISYELSLSFAVLTVIAFVGTFNLTTIVLTQQKIWFIIPLLPIFIIFYISILAETNRHPFDLPEAEAELVSGYNIEYSSMAFALFFLAEYANMLLMSSFGAFLFLGGWLPVFYLNIIPSILWLGLKICLGVVFFVVARATLPRYRYDQLMYLGWKSFLPLTLGYFILVVGTFANFNLLPD